ncbi:hypothetical protein [Sabulicella rubraurantiaca]|uniref:hypothetical protein n=1 Tax=Sabulicella rubraurantiaca TaxID=2811429 RepID=UPI001A97B162|nr:hypothetical protein [Sabulicella rubraurantiaca]
MLPHEGSFAMAELHVREAKGRVARQRARVEALESYGSPEDVDLVKRTLETMQTCLNIAHKQPQSELSASTLGRRSLRC